LRSLENDVNVSGVADRGFVDLSHPQLHRVSADDRIIHSRGGEGLRHASQSILHLVHGAFDPFPEFVAGVTDFDHVGFSSGKNYATPNAFSIFFRTTVSRSKPPPPTSAVVQPVKPISSRPLRTSSHGKSSSGEVMSTKLFFARLKPFTSSFTAR